MTIEQQLSKELEIQLWQVESTVELIDSGNTIPFIARYRKEQTGSLDDDILRKFDERLKYLRNLQQKKSDILNIITEQGNITDEIKLNLDKANTLAEIEDIYLPFKPKRTTRASIARGKGLEPLAEIIMEQKYSNKEIEQKSDQFIDIEKDVKTVAEALQGAMDIIAENLSDNADIRKALRFYYANHGVIQTKVAKNMEDKTVYSMYFEYSEIVSKIVPHRVLAIGRAEKEKVIKVSIEIDKDRCIQMMRDRVIKSSQKDDSYLNMSIQDSYSRLISSSLERELRNTLTERAEDKAIEVFAVNLKNLLLQPPIKGRITMGLDPAYRTGCKIAVVDETGKVLDHTVIYPTPPQNKIEQAKKTLLDLIDKYNIEIISIGNGTASRESELFVVEMLKESGKNVSYIIVNEAGASVYSASKLGAEEFPQYGVEIRSAVSIARRLQDPLSELVKIDPESIGVGQYQHDVTPKDLRESLVGVVESCVNSVGVDLNTASVPLLSNIAGINSTIAKNIVIYREENGHFSSRKELLKVPKLGKKSFEQSAGFLRVSESKDIFDNTGVHPESYQIAKGILDILEYTKDDVRASKIDGIKERIKSHGSEKLCNELGIGLVTLEDIVDELLKPGRDPRESLPQPILRKDVLDINKLKQDMELKGTVRNVVDFGVFVDIGVHEDGLVHISQICNKYIKHPSEVVKVGDIVDVKVIELDLKRKRVGLTMKIDK